MIDRDELAARVLCAIVSRGAYGAVGAASDAIAHTDYLLAALTPKPAVAPVETKPYVPAVGDVVRVGAGDCPYECVLVDFTNHDEIRKAWVLKCGSGIRAPRFDSWSGYWPDPVYLRPATPAERIAAGIDKPVAAEAKRPTWVRVTRAPKAAWCVTVGKVYPVLNWDGGGPSVTADDGVVRFLARPDHNDTDSMGYPAWEPCPPPPATPPAIDAGEAMLPDDARELLFDIEHAAKWACQPQGPGFDYVKDRLKELAARAHGILTPAHKCDGKGE